MLAVLGVVLAVALPGRLSVSGGVELRAAARAIADGLQRARSQAVASGVPTVFAVDVERHRFQGPGDRAPVSLPADATVALRTVQGEIAGRDVGGIRFFPDGGSTGGGITIGSHGQEYRIAVNWLTGRVEVGDGS